MNNDKFTNHGNLRTFERDIGSMSLTPQPMFPNHGTEDPIALKQWITANCEQCHKGQHRRRTGEQGNTNSNCRVNKDLILRSLIPDALVAYQSCRQVQNPTCPRIKPLATPQQPLALF